jgi:hypothetical protein
MGEKYVLYVTARFVVIQKFSKTELRPWKALYENRNDNVEKHRNIT